MAERVSSLLSLSWRLPLEGARQLTKLALSPLASLAESRGGAVGATAAGVERGVDGLFRSTEEAAGQVQDQTLSLLFDVATLKPALDALQQNFTFLGPEPELGSQKQPELEYLKAVNDAGPAGESLVILVLSVLYTAVNRQAEGIRVFEGYLRRYEGALQPWQRGVYLSSLALLQASEAEVTPIWQASALLSRAKESLRTARLAKEVTAGEPDLTENMAKIIARWTSGLLNASLPPPLGDRETALADLLWVDATVTATAEGAVLAYMFLRESYFQLAKLFRDSGDEARAAEYLALSTYPSFDAETTKIILATLFSCDAKGLRDGIPLVLEYGGGTVFNVAGQDMSEFYFIVSEDGRQLIAIDSGTRVANTKAAYEAFLSHRRERGLSAPPPLTTVIFTHAHWDHLGGHEVYRELNPEVKFYSRYNSRVEQDAATFLPPPYQWFLGEDFQIAPIATYQPDFLVEPEGENFQNSLEVGGTRFLFKLMPAGGGETPDGMFVYLENQKILFAGDFIVPWLGSPYNPEGDLESLLHSLDWISERKPDLLLHGHQAVTRFYPHWEVLARFRPHLAWLRGETLRLIHEHKTRSEIQQMNLYPPDIVAPSQADVQLPYLLMRESVINRLYIQQTGYWGPQLENVDYLSPAEYGSIFGRYLALSPETIAVAVNDMIHNGDLELAGKTADWALTYFPQSGPLQEIRRQAYLALVQKWQVVNAFKFLMYAEHIDAPVHQLQPPVGEGAHRRFSVASLQGRYELALSVGAERAAAAGFLNFDGQGMLAGLQRFDSGSGRFSEEVLRGTYEVQPNGMGVLRLERSRPDQGAGAAGSFELTPMRVEPQGAVWLTTELQAFSSELAADPKSGIPLTPPQLTSLSLRRLA